MEELVEVEVENKQGPEDGMRDSRGELHAALVRAVEDVLAIETNPAVVEMLPEVEAQVRGAIDQACNNANGDGLTWEQRKALGKLVGSIGHQAKQAVKQNGKAWRQANGRGYAYQREK
ncbi:MAG: hypothetical protein Q7R81_01710 [Candidatus Peregrinibacteria bacterium]|nr:hypothetical protein [Candidatus Peregrinibacteria bacterium]